MQNSRKIISDNLALFPEFEYYFGLIKVIEEKLESNPDMSIETCKALIEGISKSILRKLEGPTYLEREINSLDFSPLVLRTVNKISDFVDIEDTFIKRVCSLIAHIGEIRNARGDISHGKHSPKTYCSTSQFARLTMQMTDGIVEYFLELFFSIDFGKTLEYEDNPEFNEMIDDRNPLPNILYSKALFEQDLSAYKEGLDEYLNPQNYF